MMGNESRLFVGRLPRDITEDEISIVFNTYGKVADIEIHEKGTGPAFAFVGYETRKAADIAVKVLNNVYKFREDSKDTITVSFARIRGSGGGPPPAAASRDFRDLGDYRSRSFDRFGCEGMDRGSYGRGDFDRGMGRGSYGMRFDRERDFGFHGAGGGMDNRARGSKLYVANLPSDITKDAVHYVFENYGRVTDVHIMNGRSKTGQACAFVVFTDPGEARKAMMAMQQGYEIRPGQGDILVKFADDQRGPGLGGRSRPY